jgi:hypothetical protein
MASEIPNANCPAHAASFQAVSWRHMRKIRTSRTALPKDRRVMPTPSVIAVIVGGMPVREV